MAAARLRGPHRAAGQRRARGPRGGHARVRVRHLEVSDTVGYLLEGPRRRALFIPDTDAWSAWGRDIRGLVESVDFAFLDATFYSGAELPGRPPGEVPHPLVTDTLERLAGLGNRVQLIHLNHTNPLWEDPSPAVAHGFHVAQEGAAFEM